MKQTISTVTKFIKKYVSVLLLFVAPTLLAQQYGIETNYQFGYNIPIHPKYPKIEAYSHTAEIALLQQTQGKKIWSVLYKQPNVVYLFAYQTLGNQQILGETFYVVPSLDFRIFKFQRLDMNVRIGWGAGIMTKTYNSFYNKENIVIGSTINACATVRVQFRYRVLDRVHVTLGGGISHYSNAGFTKPNIGINIPFAQIGVQYYFQAKPVSDSLSAQIIANLPTLNQRFRPFITLGIGFTESGGFNGPKYPIYGVSIGVSRMMTRISKLSLSVEYLYNTAVYAFDKNNGAVVLEPLNYSRFSILATHELLFGNWGFVTSLGVYLNKHTSQRSLLATKIGFNFYFKNYFKHFKHQLWAGCHVRAYGGEAEFVEFVLGYNW